MATFVQVLEPLDHPYDPYRSRALTYVAADTEDDACNKIEIALQQMRHAKLLRAKSRAGKPDKDIAFTRG